jgi:hypothetical protein
MRLVDLFWVMGPDFAHASNAGVEAAARGANHAAAATGGWWHVWMFPAAAVGIGGIWVLGYVSQLRRRPLLPLNDRRLTRAATGGH